MSFAIAAPRQRSARRLPGGRGLACLQRAAEPRLVALVQGVDSDRDRDQALLQDLLQPRQRLARRRRLGPRRRLGLRGLGLRGLLEGEQLMSPKGLVFCLRAVLSRGGTCEIRASDFCLLSCLSCSAFRRFFCNISNMSMPSRRCEMTGCLPQPSWQPFPPPVLPAPRPRSVSH